MTNKDLENILMQISIKSALLDKLGIKLDREDFEAKLKKEFPENAANISDCIKNLCDFGLISRNMSDKLIEKYGLQKTQNDMQNVAVSDFAGLEGEIQDYFSSNSDLKNLIEKSDIVYDANALKEIYCLAKKLEQSAIEGYKKELENSKKNEIKAPKSLINQASINSCDSSSKINKKDIGKMSTEEFLKNEQIINKLLRQKML